MTSPAVPAPAPLPVDDAEARFSLLEMDSGASPSDSMPPWARDAIARLNAAQDLDAVAAIIAPLKAQPEGPIKATVRAVVESTVRLLRAAAANRASAPVAPAGAPTTARQAIPVVVATAATVATPVEAPTQVAPATLSVDTRPLTGTYVQIKSGPSRGEWGARIEHGAARGGAVPGSVALIQRRNGGSQPKRLIDMVWTDGMVSIFTIQDVPRNTPATPRVSAPSTRGTNAAPAQGPAAHMAQQSAPLVTLVSDLVAVATDAAANAAHVAANTTGSMADGARRFVGFDSAAGYIQAIRNGVPANTHAEYLRTLRGTYNMSATEIAALNLPGPMMQSDAPVGAGRVVMPTGPSIFDLPREQRDAARRAQRGLTVGKSDKSLTGARLMNAGDLIGGAIAAGAGGEFGWEGSKSCTRGSLIAALETIDRASDAPAAKDARAQIGRAVRAMLGNDYDVQALQGAARKDLPKGVSHAHIVCRKLSGTDITLVAGIGTEGEVTQQILLKVYLHDDDTVSYVGDDSLAALVRNDFDRRVASEVLISADLTAWLQRTLIRVHGATSYGRHWYVPGGEREAAIALTRAVRSTGWGCRWLHGSTLTTESAVIEGLTDGLAGEIEACETEWTRVCDKAREDHAERVGKGKIGGSHHPSPHVAASQLAKLIEAGERVRGYAVLLGDDAVAPLRTRIATLEDLIRPLTDDTSARGALLEFT